MTTVAEYHQSVIARFIADPLVSHCDIRRERRTLSDGHLRARLTLSNGDLLEFSEYVRQTEGQIEVVTYSFHWMNAAGNLIRRWDNAPHAMDLPQAPHHVHDSEETNLLPSTPTSIIQVLDDIATRLSP